MTKIKNTFFNTTLYIWFLFYLFQYLFEISGLYTTKYPYYFDAAIYLFYFICYIWVYRKNNILCFEIMAFPILFLGIFLSNLLAPIADGIPGFFTVSNDLVREKSKDLQMMAYFAYMIGGGFTIKNYTWAWGAEKKMRRGNYSILIHIITIVILLLLVYDYSSGILNSWFYYSNADWMDVDDRNQGLGHLTCLILAATVVEIVRLREQNVSTLKVFFKRCNKLFIFEWALVSFLLFISGNRNEMLLIALPLVVGYSKCIEPIKNRHIIVAMIVGVFLMIAVGMTRQSSVSLSGGELSLITSTRDFWALGYNTDFLVEYTDAHGSTYFADMPPYLLSGIPYLGPKLIDWLGLKWVMPSAALTTESVNTHSGLGTALVGDLYYSAGAIWVILFMFLLGRLLSNIYFSNKNLNVYLLTLYVYMVANAVYYIRSAWAFPITVIEYVWIILLIGEMLPNISNTGHYENNISNR